jgi:predicted ABC-type ATPase
MPNLYIIAGCNGSGKTTASNSLLPDMLDCKEFVNADSIAAGISPFNVESVAFEAGRIMLSRIKFLLDAGEDFAFETTLSTRSYVGLIKNAKAKGYEVNLIFFWLDSVEMAKQRVKYRYKRGGHNIPENVIKRRYFRGIKNLINLYIPVYDNWTVFNNLRLTSELLAEGKGLDNPSILNKKDWDSILKISDYE